MKNEEIIMSAIEKAKDNGYEDYPTPLCVCDYEEYLELEQWSMVFIFNHDFAKAFSKYITKTDEYFVGEAIQSLVGRNSGNIFTGNVKEQIKNNFDYCVDCVMVVFLEKMVLEEDPIKYLSKFI